MISSVSRVTSSLKKVRLPFVFPRRNAGGFLKKNIYVEENAGIRENGYKTWNFNGSNLVRFFFMLVLPGTLFTFSVINEMKIKDQLIDEQREYGLLPELKK